VLYDQGWEFITTRGTHELLVRNGIAARFVFKVSEQSRNNILEPIAGREAGLIINLPETAFNSDPDSDGFKIRRLAIDYHIPLVTNYQLAEMLLESLSLYYGKTGEVLSYRELHIANH